MGSSNGNVAVAELKYKPMQSRCEAAQFSTRGVHVPPPQGLTDTHGAAWQLTFESIHACHARQGTDTKSHKKSSLTFKRAARGWA